MTSKKDSTDRFGYEWNKFSKIVPDYEIQFKKWVTPLKRKDFKNKTILDAGCGTGRNSIWPAMYGAKKVVAFDYDKRTVDVAKKNLRFFNNVEVKYQSIYDIKDKNKFDISFSIGVIHHLENPGLGIRKLIQATKKKGKVLIWVYGYEGNEWIVKYISPIRKITSRLPVWMTNILAYGLSVPLYLYLHLGRYNSEYLNQLANFKFWHIHSIVFDQLLPKIANYYTKKEAIDLLKKAGLKRVKAYRINNNSWSVIGVKK